APLRAAAGEGSRSPGAAARPPAAAAPARRRGRERRRRPRPSSVPTTPTPAGLVAVRPVSARPLRPWSSAAGSDPSIHGATPVLAGYRGHPSAAGAHRQRRRDPQPVSAGGLALVAP